MIMITVERNWTTQYPDGICSFPYGYRDLRLLTEFKNNLKLPPQNLIEKHENHILIYGQNLLKENERMRIINSVITQQPIFCKKGTVKRTQFQLDYTTRVFLLKSLWRKI